MKMSLFFGKLIVAASVLFGGFIATQTGANIKQGGCSHPSDSNTDAVTDSSETAEESDSLDLETKQQAEADSRLALECYAYSDFSEAIRFANRAIQADRNCFPARHIRSLIYLLQEQDYENALLQMQAVGSDLRVRVASEVQVRSEANVVGTAEPGDVLRVNNVVNHGNETWVQVVGLQKRNADSARKASYTPVSGFVQASMLKTPETARAQLQEFFTPQKTKPSRPVVKSDDATTSFDIHEYVERRHRAESAVDTYNSARDMTVYLPNALDSQRETAPINEKRENK